MTLKYSQGFYKLNNPEKYIGGGQPKYRSSWERIFMAFCDNNPSVQQWASESIKIPYRDPLTGKNTVYVPDFFLVYIDKNMKKHAELIEIKPMKQTLREHVGKNPYDQAQFIKNMAKWEAAKEWSRRRNVHFRVINENDIFVNTKKRK